VPRFDAELFLRLAGEEMILGVGARRQGPWESPLFGPASALVAVGAISAAKARAVIDDYSVAQTLRTEEGHHLHHRIAFARANRSRRPKSEPLKARRVVPCDRTIEDDHGTLHVRHVTLSEDTTSVAITWRPKPSNQKRSRQRHMISFGPGSSGPPEPVLSDDRGTSTGTDFGGSGSDDEWHGHLTTTKPLARDTAWFEIDGVRIELTGEVSPSAVSVEALAELPVAHRYLWRQLELPHHFHDRPDIDGPIDALIAAGVLDADDPVLSELRLVREAMPDHPGMHAGAPRRDKRMPEPWRSLLSRQGRHDGPEGMIAVSAVTPEFDGFSVAVNSIESQPEGFSIEVDVAPGTNVGGPFQSGLESRQLAWWAADDRGNHHLGNVGSWSGGDDRSSGEIHLWPALHPKARLLRIMPTAEERRAVISVPLTWASGDGGDVAEP
jgi:hypothetical protein